MHSSSILLPLIATFAAAAPLVNTTASSTSYTREPVNGLANNLDVIKSLLLAPKAADRIAIISQDSDFVFDFSAPPANSSTVGSGGSTVAATRQSFPPLVGSNTAMTVGFLGPCGFNTPHTHPRSAEINILVEGRVNTSFILENGARTVNNILLPWQMTTFPQGALHTEFNPDCTNATFVAAFANEDPGVQQEAQAFFGLDEAVVEAAVGNGFTFEGKDITKFRSLIPKNVANGVDACLKKCNITPNPSS